MSLIKDSRKAPSYPCNLILIVWLVMQFIVFPVLILLAMIVFSLDIIWFIVLFLVSMYIASPFVGFVAVLVILIESLALIRINWYRTNKRKQKEKIKYQSSYRYEPKQISKSIQDLAQESTSDKNIVIEDDGEIDHRQLSQ